VLNDGFDSRNFVVLARVETVFPLWFGFSAGPVFWSHIRPLKGRIDQYAGASVKFQRTWRMLDMDQTLRIGTAGTLAPVELWWDMSIGVGKWMEP
jgi:hypothetical protein